MHLAREAWRAELLDPKTLGEVRGRDVDEAGFQRALYRSSIGEIEYLLGPILKGRRVIVEGRLPIRDDTPSCASVRRSRN